MDPKSQARLIADTMQTAAGNANPPVKVSTQMKAALVAAFGDGLQDNLSREIKSLPDIEFANATQNLKVPVFVPFKGTRNFEVQNEVVWAEANQPEVLEKLGIGVRAVAYTARLAKYASIINMGKNLKNIARKDGNGQWIIPVGNQSVTETELMSEINGIAQVLIADALALETGKNALNRMWEVKRLEEKTGSRPSGLLELGDLFAGVLPQVRVARIKPFIQLRDNEVRALAVANGLYIPGGENAVLPDLDAIE
jgi:hypothetical protein